MHSKTIVMILFSLTITASTYSMLKRKDLNSVSHERPGKKIIVEHTLDDKENNKENIPTNMQDISQKISQKKIIKKLLVKKPLAKLNLSLVNNQTITISRKKLIEWATVIFLTGKKETDPQDMAIHLKFNTPEEEIFFAAVNVLNILEKNNSDLLCSTNDKLIQSLSVLTEHDIKQLITVSSRDNTNKKILLELSKKFSKK